MTIDYASLAAALERPDGGFTIDSVGLSVDTGYAVSVRPDLTRVFRMPPVTWGQVMDYGRSVASVWQEPGSVLGGWHDPATGYVHLDVTRVVDTALSAFTLACAFGQLAFFDLARGVSVPIADPRF